MLPGSHLLALGADIEVGQRDQTSGSINNGQAEFITSGDTVSARTRHVSAFVQDEWDITPKWSANLGLRWEGILTSSQTRANQIDNTSHVISPVLHNVWRLPGDTKDQVRLGLTRSYRAPTLADLTAAPTLSRLNSATRPDSQGNPNLRPELATGVDLAFEHYLSRSGIMSVNLFRRNLTDLIRRTTTFQNGRWVASPANFGRANTSGVELEAKFQLAERKSAFRPTTCCIGMANRKVWSSPATARKVRKPTPALMPPSGFNWNLKFNICCIICWQAPSLRACRKSPCSPHHRHSRAEYTLLRQPLKALPVARTCCGSTYSSSDCVALQASREAAGLFIGGRKHCQQPLSVKFASSFDSLKVR